MKRTYCSREDHSTRPPEHMDAEPPVTRVPLCGASCFSLAWGKWAREVLLRARQRELGSATRAPSVRSGRGAPDEAQAEETLPLRSGWFGESHLSWSCITSGCTIRPSSPANTGGCRPRAKNASCKFSCKKEAKEILGLNSPLLCLCDLPRAKDFQGLFWWSLGEIKCIVCRRISAIWFILKDLSSPLDTLFKYQVPTASSPIPFLFCHTSLVFGAWFETQWRSPGLVLGTNRNRTLKHTQKLTKN